MGISQAEIVKALAQLSSVTVDEMRFQDAHSRPQTDEDLWEYIAAYYGFKIPRVAVCKNHIAPFQFIADVFFERVNNAILFANRSGGKTQCLAILHHLNGTHKPYYETASIGAIQAQALKCYEYVIALTNLRWFEEDCVYKTMRQTKFRNGSLVQVLSGTASGVNSPHPVCAVFDEVELMGWAVLQEAFSMAASSGNYKATQILTSTRKYPSGTIQRLLDRVKEGTLPFEIFSYCIFESVERCTLPDCEQCKEVIRVKEGKRESWYDLCHDDPDRHPDGKCKASDGFILLSDVLTKFATVDWDVFDAQWLCHKPGRKGLVFDMFDEEVHCKQDLVQDWRARLMADRTRSAEDRELEIAITMDMGWADPLAVLFVAKDKRDNLFLFDSIYESGLDLRDFVPMMQKRFDYYSIPPSFLCHCDEHAPREISDLNKLGLRVTPIGAPVEDRISAIRTWFGGNYRDGHPTVCIDPQTCAPLIQELNTLKYKLDKQGNPKGELPDKGPDHLIDSLGYAFSAFGLIGVQYKVRLLRDPTPPKKSPYVVATRSDWTRRKR